MRHICLFLHNSNLSNKFHLAELISQIEALLITFGLLDLLLISNWNFDPWKWNGQEHNFGALNVLALPFLVLRGHYWCCWISDQRGSGGAGFDKKISFLYSGVRWRKFCGFCAKQNIPAFTFGSIPSYESWYLNFCGDLDHEKFLLVYLYPRQSIYIY